jgi:hypothetical protein
MASISLLMGSPLTIMFSAGFHTQHARQALRATCAGHQAQLDFRQRHAAVPGAANAVMATQCQFQAAAHAHRVNGGQSPAWKSSPARDHAQQVGLLHGLGAAEFLDVRTTRKGLAGTGDDDGLDGGISIGLGQPSAMP